MLALLLDYLHFHISYRAAVFELFLCSTPSCVCTCTINECLDTVYACTRVSDVVYLFNSMFEQCVYRMAAGCTLSSNFICNSSAGIMFTALANVYASRLIVNYYYYYCCQE